MHWALEETDPHGDAWKRFLEKTPHLLFHEPVWSDILRAGISSRVECLLFRENGMAKSGALGFVLGAFGINIAYFSYPYGSLIGSPPPADDLSSMLREFSNRRGICQLQFVGYPGAPELPTTPFSEMHDSTQVLPLEGLTPETLWQSYRRSRRQDIKKTRDRGVTVEESTAYADIDDVHRFYLETMQRTAGVARYKKSLIESIVGNLAPKGKARLLVAKHESEPIAGMLIADSDHLSHGLLLASSSAARKWQPNKLLLHTAAERACAAGKSGLDYMPSGQSDVGVSNFKKLWGAEEVPLVHYTMNSAPVRSWIWRRAYGLASHQPFRSILTAIRKRRS